MPDEAELSSVTPVRVAATVRPQVVPTGKGADPRDLDRLDTEVAKLRHVGGPEIESDPAIGTVAQVRSLAARSDEVGARLVDGVATGTDRGADRRDEPRRARTRADERADERLRDAQARALPARVRRSDSTGCGIDDEDRHAVGGGDAEQHPGFVGPKRIGFRPCLDGLIEADDGVAMDLADARDRVESEPAREGAAVRFLLVEGKHRPGHAPLRARREPGEDVVALEQRRPQKAVALDPGRGDHAHRVGVASARIAATIPASAPMSQKRIVTLTSGHSNWLCNGAMRKIRLPRSLKLPT